MHVGTCKTPLWHSQTPALPPTQMMRNTWMPDLTRRRWRKPSTISYCGWRKKEKKSFKDLATILSQLPKPAQGSVRSMSVADAIKAGFLSALDKDTADMFILSELRLYRHAQDRRSNWDIQG